MKSYVRVSKNALDMVDLNLDLIRTVNSFGSFIKYVVIDEEESDGATAARAATTTSAFSVLMNSQST